jgi:hypothetical protein
MKTDPTDTGGLFVGRRPGTRPIRYRALPERGSAARQVVDRVVSGFIQFLMILVNLTFWGPLPLAWLWVASRVQYWTDNVFYGIVAGFAGLIASLMIGLVLLKRLDHTWILVRRAAGYDQREGRMGIIFAVCCVIGTVAFTFWFLIINGPGSSVGISGP